MFEGLKKWSARVFVGKLARRGLRVAIAALVAKVPESAGVTIDPEKTFVAAWAGLEGFASYVKTKTTGTKWETAVSWVF